MSLIKKSYLRKLRAELVKEKGYDIPDDAWNQIVNDIEKDIREKLSQTLPKAILFTIYEVAEKGDLIIEIDGKDIGKEIRQLRRIYEWLKQKRKYFGW